MEEAKKEWYLIVCEEWGIFLGQGCWSKLDYGDGRISAKAYSKERGVELLKQLVASNPNKANKIKLVEIWPDLPDNEVSEAACQRVGLERWEPHLFNGEDL